METSSDMKVLNLKEALELYRLIGAYIPTGVEDHLQVADIIVTKAEEDDNKEAISDAVCLMSGKSVEELLAMQPEEVTKLFVFGLVRNEVSLLKTLCMELYNVRHAS